jgi:hypothetical protein
MPKVWHAMYVVAYAGVGCLHSDLPASCFPGIFPCQQILPEVFLLQVIMALVLGACTMWHKVVVTYISSL